MKSFKSAHGKLVEVYWQDISGYSGWHSPDEEWTTQACRSMGYLIKLDTKNIYVAQDVAVTGRMVDQVGNIMVIPKSNVTKLRVLAAK